MKYMNNDLTFTVLRSANQERRIRDDRFRSADWTSSDWVMAAVGEFGELANLLKKINRGDFPLEQVREEVAHELADVVTYLDILANELGVDLGDMVAQKFNIVSRRINSPVSIEPNNSVLISKEIK